MRIAFIGNPNSGKTTMFNAFTGANETVGNWAGVTIEKKERPAKKEFLQGKEKVLLIDLPGAYSLTSFTSEEAITASYIHEQKPDVIINIVDATNISRSLFFTTQLTELGIPLVVALNKSDVNEKNGTVIDEALLAKRLHCPVIKTASVQKEGLHELLQQAILRCGQTQTPAYTDTQQADAARFAFVGQLVKDAEERKVLSAKKTKGDILDRILLNKWLGIPIFALVMFLVFQISQTYLGTWIAQGATLPNGTFLPGLVPLLELFQAWIASLLTGASPFLASLLVDGMIGGMIAVVGFLPLVMVMYFLLALLEDCGYLSRVAVLLDPIFQRVGLSGKSVIPFVMTIGCAVPGIMASRTIRSERERRATAMLAPFMPCGAKIPVIALFAGIFFDNSGFISALMYLLGILLIFFGALLVRFVTEKKKANGYFIMELAQYKAPSLRNACKTMCSRGAAYVVKAATVILLCNTAVQLLQTFTVQFTVAETAQDSLLALVAKPFAYLLFPLIGVLSWQFAAAFLTGFIAKENVVGTLAVCFVGLKNLVHAEDLSLLEGAGTQAASILAISKAAALSYLLFTLFSPPCFAAIAAMRSEMKSAKWVLAGLGLQLGVGYSISYLVYTVGTLLTAPKALAVVPALLGLAIVLLFAGCLLFLIRRNTRQNVHHFTRRKTVS